MNDDINLEEINKKRAERLKMCRKEKGYSLAYVAELIGVKHPTISRWESGFTSSIKFPHLLKLAEIFQVNPDWLWGYDVPKTIETLEHKNKRDEISTKLREVSDEELERVSQMIDLLLNK